MARINLNPNRYSKKKAGKFKPYPSYNYSNDDAVEKLTNYIINPEKTDSRYVNYHNVSPSTPKAVQNSFAAVQRLYGKASGRHAEHFVISMSKEESAILGEEGVSRIADKYCATFAGEYQVVSAVHIERPEQLHFHVEINPVSFMTGKRLHKDGAFLRHQRMLVQKLVDQQMEELK